MAAAKGKRKHKQSVAHKTFEGTNVWEAALLRCHHIYDLHDFVYVSFSGGKDSTATLNVALKVAEERDRLPLTAVFFDEEAIPYETEEYVRRVGQDPRVDLKWLCLPIKENNACSLSQPTWWPWAPESEDLWVRPMPPEAITADDLEVWDFAPEDRPAHLDGIDHLLFGPELGQVCNLLGIRAAESMMRFRAVNRRSHDEDNYIIPATTKRFADYGHLFKGYPIYDWTGEDVWTAPRKFGWDTNEAYDIMAMAGMPPTMQRCSPAYGTEPLQKLHTYRECFPDVWDKMLERVPGAAAAARYALTELYGYKAIPPKPEGIRWIDFVRQFLDRQADEWRAKSQQQITEFVRRHHQQTTDPILVNSPHPSTGLNWLQLVQIAMRGDPRGRKQPGTKAAVNPERWRLMKQSYDDEYAALEEAGRLWEVTLA